MVVLLGDWRFSSHGQAEDGMTVAPELSNGTALSAPQRSWLTPAIPPSWENPSFPGVLRKRLDRCTGFEACSVS